MLTEHHAIPIEGKPKNFSVFIGKQWHSIICKIIVIMDSLSEIQFKSQKEKATDKETYTLVKSLQIDRVDTKW